MCQTWAQELEMQKVSQEALAPGSYSLNSSLTLWKNRLSQTSTAVARVWEFMNVHTGWATLMLWGEGNNDIKIKIGDNRSRSKAEKTWSVRLKPVTKTCQNWKEGAGGEVETSQSWNQLFRVKTARLPCGCGPREERAPPGCPERVWAVVSSLTQRHHLEKWNKQGITSSPSRGIEREGCSWDQE